MLEPPENPEASEEDLDPYPVALARFDRAAGNPPHLTTAQIGFFKRPGARSPWNSRCSPKGVTLHSAACVLAIERGASVVRARSIWP